MSVARLQLLVAAASLTVATVHAWVLRNPAHDPYDKDLWLGIGTQLPSGVATAIVAVVALLGAVAAVALRPGRRLVAVAGVEVVVLGLLAPDASLLAILGYLSALALPVGAVVVLAFAARRVPALGPVLAVLLVGGAVWGTRTGALDPEAMGRLAGDLRDGFAGLGLRPWLLLGSGAAGLLWGWLLVRALGAEPLADFALRWGRLATLVAICCPLPYVLARLTWLTPWPMGTPGPQLELAPEIRLWGILLGLAALVGSLLTVGLISSWGERFPRWTPGLTGRRVPVTVAAVPAGLVAWVIVMSAPSMVAQAWVEGDLLYLLLFPLPVWGPALALATVAYVLRRRTEDAGAQERRELSAAG
jgi:hypothetical protein